MPPTSSVHDVRTLVLSFHPIIVFETVEEERVRGLVRDVALDIGLPFFEWSVTRGLVRAPGSSMIHGTTDPRVMLKHVEALTVEGIFLFKDFGPYLRDPQVTRQFRELIQTLSKTRSTIVLSGEQLEFPAEISHRIAFYDLCLPTRDELKTVLETVIRSLRTNHRIKVELKPGDLTELIRALGGMTLNQARQTIAWTILEDGRLDSSDIQKVVGRKAQLIRDEGLVEFFPVEDNVFELGGFDNMKKWLERAHLGFSDAAQQLNLTPPRGILIVGIQGCGKSLSAKVISRQWKMPLLKLEAGRLYGKYVGESERNFRKAVSMAESMAPTLLWIDEIEKGFATGLGGENDGGVSRRLMGAFLTWMQEKKDDVFVVATANDLSALPPEFLRKGRFDETFFVDLPREEDRRTIFKIHLKLRRQSPESFDLDALTSASQGFSGAEIEQAVIAALYRSLHEKKLLETETLLKEIADTIPLSVSRREDIEKLRVQAQQRFVSVH